MKKQVSSFDVLVVDRFFTSKDFTSKREKILEAWNQGDVEKVNRLFGKLPSVEEMMLSLIEKLKGKSVYQNLKDVSEGKSKDKIDELKGVSSLLTHSLIEIQKGNKEYMLLVARLYEQLGELLFLYGENK